MSTFLKHAISLLLVVVTAVGLYVLQDNKAEEQREAIQKALQAYVDNSLATTNNPTLGADVQNIAGTSYTLSGGGVSPTGTSIILSSFTLPQTGYEIQDSDLSSTFYVTLEPGNRSKQEIVSCTTVTQNSGSTATLSGCSRGLLPIAPYTASTTYAFAHGGGSTLIFSNPPQYDEQFAKQANSAYITGAWGYAALPTSTVVCVNLHQLCNKQYIDGLTVQGAATSTEDTLGLVELATNAEASASTASSTSGRPLVLLSRYSTSTPSTVCTSISCIVMTSSGKIAQAFLDLTQSFAFGNITSSNSTSTNATSTSFFVTNFVATNASITNGVSAKITTNTGPSSIAGGTSSTTIFSLSIPANTLSTGNSVNLKAYVSAWSGGGTYELFGEMAYGSATTALHFIQAGVHSGSRGVIDINLTGAGTTGSQEMSTFFNIAFPAQSAGSDLGVVAATSSGYVVTSAASQDSTTAKNLMLVLRSISGGVTFTVDQVVVESIK